MATFTAGTSFTDGVTGDVTAAKLNALVANATPLSNFITDRTAETSIATDDLVLISDTSDSGALNKMTVANFTNIVSTGTGTAADPAIRPTSDTNTGIFFPAADTIAFSEGGTESMRIDSNGRVGIGTNSPSYTLDVSGSSAAVGNFNSTGNTYIGLSRSGTRNLLLQAASEAGYLYQEANLPLVFGTNNTERLRIDSSGNVLIGTTSASVGATGRGLLEVNGSTDSLIALKRGGTNGLYLYTSSAEGRVSQTENLPLTLYTNNTERLRIDSSGNVGVGTTSPSYKLHVNSGGNQPVLFESTAIVSVSYFKDSGTTVTPYCGSSGNNFYIGTNSVERLRITSDGEVYIAGTTDQGAYNLQVNGTGVWGAGAYVNGSDERLKENIQDITSGLDVVEKLRPVSFQYKEEYTADRSIQSGFIAQDLLVALEGKNYLEGVVSQGPTYYNVAYQNLIPILAKAIQELKTINNSQAQTITSLESRITALEAV